MFGIGGDGGEVIVRSPVLAAGKTVVAAVFARLGFEDEVPTGESVEQHVDQTGTCDERSGDAEVGETRCIAPRGGHSAGGQRKGKHNVRDRVDNHVSDDSTETLQTRRVAASENC